MNIEINKVLTNPPRKRILILSNHFAERTKGKPGFLTQEEIIALVSSFRTAKELALYNEYKEMLSNVNLFLTNLSQFKISYLESLQRLDEFLVIKQSYIHLEHTSNLILDFIPDLDMRRKVIVKIAENFPNPYISSHIQCGITEGDGIQDGHLLVNHNLDHHIKGAYAIAEHGLTNLKTAIQAVKTFMKDKKFKVQTFSNFVTHVENWANRDKDSLLLLKTKKSENKTPAHILTEPDYASHPIDEKKYHSYLKDFLRA